MLADAFKSEAYRLSRNRTAVFWGVIFVPILLLVVGTAGQFFVKARMEGAGTEGLPPEVLQSGPLDWGMGMVDTIGDLANPLVLLFTLIAAATLFAGDYRWETWRLISARNSRLNMLLGKTGVLILLILAASLLYLVTGVISDLIQSAIFSRSLTFTFGAEQAGDFALVAAINITRVVQFTLMGLLAAVLTRSLLAALFIPLVVGVAQFFLGQFSPLLGLEPTGWVAQLLMPGLATDTLKMVVLGGPEGAGPPPDGVVLKAVLGLALWTAVPLGLAIAWFNRQDLSKE